MRLTPAERDMLSYREVTFDRDNRETTRIAESLVAKGAARWVETGNPYLRRIVALEDGGRGE